MSEGKDIVGYIVEREKGTAKVRYVCNYTYNSKKKVSFVQFTSHKEIACRVDSILAEAIYKYLGGLLGKEKIRFIERIK